MKKLVPYLITGATVLGVLIVYKMAKPYLPAFITALIPL